MYVCMYVYVCVYVCMYYDPVLIVHLTMYVYVCMFVFALQRCRKLTKNAHKQSCAICGVRSNLAHCLRYAYIHVHEYMSI